jgi:hypothetical protein
MVAVEGLRDTDPVSTLELPRLTGPGGTVLHLVLSLHTILDPVTHQTFVDTGVALQAFVGLAREGVCRTGPLLCYR